MRKVFATQEPETKEALAKKRKALWTPERRRAQGELTRAIYKAQNENGYEQPISMATIKTRISLRTKKQAAWSPEKRKAHGEKIKELYRKSEEARLNGIWPDGFKDP